MAVRAPAKPNLPEDFDDDDGPVIFKRTNIASKQNQVKKELKRASSHGNDGLLGSSCVQSSNGKSYINEKGNAVPPANGLPAKSPPGSSEYMKSPIGSPKASSSTVPSKSTNNLPKNPIASKSLDNLPKGLSKQGVPVSFKEESNSDSEDDKPLSSRLQGNTSNSSKVAPSPTPSKVTVKNSSDDSDDEKPLASRLPQKSSADTSASKPLSSEKKTMVPKSLENGLSSKDGRRIFSIVSTKRPLEKGSSSEPSNKKPNTSLLTAAVGSKCSVKGQEVDDDDHIPISQRMKQSAPSTSASKSSTTKENIRKVASKKITKITQKTKKRMKQSQYSKSTKMQPSSGDGQKKWSTLEHNGVIFPPPYKPHEVKMLYKGKPVDLTPEQEEVATMFAVMQDTDYMQKNKFKENFWNDWRKILGSKHVIQKLENCDFSPIYDWCQQEKDKKKQMTKQEKDALKEEKVKLEEKYTWAMVDGVKEKVTFSHRSR